MANTLRFKRGLATGIPTALAGEPLFTTDTFDLYIGNGTTNTRFQKYIASGTTSQLLRGDGSLLTMPIVLTSPSNGQVLKYDGTNWVNSADAGVTGSGTTNYLSKWTSSSALGNSLVFDNGTNVLINTTTALWSAASRQTFEINGAAQSLLALNVANTSAGYLWHSGTYLSLANTRNSFISFVTNSAEYMRLHATGNLSLNSTTDNGLRFQVTGDTSLTGSGNTSATTALSVRNSDTLQLFNILNNGNVGIPNASSSGYSLNIGKSITGSIISAGIWQNGSVLADVTTLAIGIYNFLRIPASTAISSYQHFRAEQAAFGAGGTLGTQIGFIAENSLIGATNNYGFYGNIASGTGRWNLYMNGTAANYLAGNTGIGVTPSFPLHVSGVTYITGNVNIGSSSQQKVTQFGGAATGLTITSATYPILSLWDTGDTNWNFMLGMNDGLAYIWNQANSAITFSTNATERMRLHAGGNLAVGTTTDAGFRLDVNGTMRVSGASTFGGNLNLPNTGEYYLQNAASTTFIGLNFDTPYIRFAVGGSVRAFMNATGLGLGTASPSARLDVVGVSGTTIIRATAADTNGNADVEIRATGTTGSSRLFFGDTAATSGSIIYNHASDAMLFSTAATTRATLDASGNLALGIATASSRLHVDAAAGSAHIRISEGGTTRGFVGGANGIATGRNGWFMVRGEAGLVLSGNGNSADIIINPTTANVQIGGTSDTGERLQVNGTMRVSGASTFSTSVSVASGVLNQGYLLTAAGTTALTRLQMGTAVTLFSNNYNAFSPASQDNNTIPSWQIRFGGGAGADFYRIERSPAGSTTMSQFFNLDGTGAATFSSSVTAGGNLLLTNGTASSIGAINLIRTGTSPVASRLTFGTDGTGYSFAIGKNQGGTVTDLVTILDSGLTTFTDNARFKNTKGILFENASASPVGSIKIGLGATSPLEITNGTHTITLATLGTFVSSNLLVGASTIGLSSTNTIAVANGTAPSSSATDIFHLYSADVVAGNAAPHFRTENGAVIKLYQETTGVGNSIISLGGGNAVLDDTTFDGYTLRQIVKALRNQGILA